MGNLHPATEDAGGRKVSHCFVLQDAPAGFAAAVLPTPVPSSSQVLILNKHLHL